MAGKRYYWLRLHDDFFDSKRIKKLRRMAGGDTYTIIYLKMQLLAMKTDGTLTWTGLEDSIADELALDLDEEVDNVKVTLAYLISCGLAETDDNVNFFFPYAVENTGSETASTQRSRECRLRQKEQKVLQCNTSATLLQRECNVEIEKEIEIDTIDREKENIKKETRHKYGEYKNVLLSDDDLSKLKSEFPDWEQRIERLSSYIASTGKSYKNHLATIRNWARKDPPPKETSYDVNEFFQAAVNRYQQGRTN